MDPLLILFIVIVPWFFATFGLVPRVARAKGHSGFDWFFVALFVTPLLALIALAAMPDNRNAEQEVPAEDPELHDYRLRKS